MTVRSTLVRQLGHRSLGNPAPTWALALMHGMAGRRLGCILCQRCARTRCCSAMSVQEIPRRCGTCDESRRLPHSGIFSHCNPVHGRFRTIAWVLMLTRFAIKPIVVGSLAAPGLMCCMISYRQCASVCMRTRHEFWDAMSGLLEQASDERGQLHRLMQFVHLIPGLLTQASKTLWTSRLGCGNLDSSGGRVELYRDLCLF
jgi:hypothetical protein